MISNSGAEALENAIKVSKAYTKRAGILSANGSFHGRTLMTMSTTSKYKPYKNGFGPYASDNISLTIIILIESQRGYRQKNIQKSA